MNRRAADDFYVAYEIDTGFWLQEKLDEGEQAAGENGWLSADEVEAALGL